MGTSLSSKDTFDEDPYFVTKMKCHITVQKHLEVLFGTDTITSGLVLGKSPTLINYFRNEVLPLPEDFSHPPSYVCNVFDRLLNFSIL